jgi:phage/plasmid-like protein (TIGR03299 family)
MLTQLKNATNAQEALDQAGLNWTVEVAPLRVELPSGEMKNLSDQRIIVRDDKVLGIVGSRYHAVNNGEIFTTADGVINSIGGFYTQAGSFRGGSRVMLQVQLPNTLTLGRDEVKRYLTFINSFDGSFALRAFITPIRPACENMVRLALSKATDSVSIRHSANALVRLRDVERVIAVSGKYHAKFDEAAQTLFRTKFSHDSMVKLAKDLIPVRIDDTGTPIDSTRAQNNRARLVALFEGGKGHVETGIVGTAWGAFNAVAEYVDHERGTRTKTGEDQEEKRVESAWFGSGATMKTRAFEAIRTMAGI